MPFQRELHWMLAVPGSPVRIHYIEQFLCLKPLRNRLCRLLSTDFVLGVHTKPAGGLMYGTRAFHGEGFPTPFKGRGFSHALLCIINQEHIVYYIPSGTPRPWHASCIIFFCVISKNLSVGC